MADIGASDRSLVGNSLTLVSPAEIRLDGTLIFDRDGVRAVFRPSSSDGAALGDTGRMWSDIFLASGGVVNFNNGNVTVTHSAGALTFAGASIGLGAAAHSVNGEAIALNKRARFTIAEVNAGATVLAAVTGFKYRMIDCEMIAIGGNVAAVTTIDVKATQAAGAVILVSYAQASLTRSAVLKAGGTGATVLADGASYVQNDASTAITVIKAGLDITTATHIDVILTYALEA